MRATSGSRLPKVNSWLPSSAKVCGSPKWVATAGPRVAASTPLPTSARKHRRVWSVMAGPQVLENAREAGGLPERRLDLEEPAGLLVPGRPQSLLAIPRVVGGVPVRARGDARQGGQLSPAERGAGRRELLGYRPVVLLGM